MQPFQEPILAVTHNDIADAEHAAEHHVHTENARQYPVYIAHRVAENFFFLNRRWRSGARLEQREFDKVTFGGVRIDPVTGCRIELDEHIELVPGKLCQRGFLVTGGHEPDVAHAQEGVLFRDDVCAVLQHGDGVSVTVFIEGK